MQKIEAQRIIQSFSFPLPSWLLWLVPLKSESPDDQTMKRSKPKIRSWIQQIALLHMTMGIDIWALDSQNLSGSIWLMVVGRGWRLMRNLEENFRLRHGEAHPTRGVTNFASNRKWRNSNSVLCTDNLDIFVRISWIKDKEWKQYLSSQIFKGS